MTETFAAKYVYRVKMMESGGWDKDYWHVDFDSEEAAVNYITTTNAKNNLPYVPDYYVVALGYSKVLVEA